MRLLDVRGIAAVALAVVLVGSGGPVAAGVRPRQQAWSHVVTPVQTDVPTFFGSGHGPSSPMIVTSSQLEPDVEMGPDLFQAVYYALQGGATEVVVVFTADDTAATLGSAIESYAGLPAPQSSTVGDLYAVPALADLSVEDHLSVASKLIGLAVRLNGLALLEPPTATLDEAVANDDVAPFIDLANQLRSSVGLAAAGHAALYTGGVTNFDPVSSSTTLNEVVPIPFAGPMAGLVATTDITRHVWRAPAGTGAMLEAYGGLFSPTDAQMGELEMAGVNPVFVIPQTGPVAWGARTLAGLEQDSTGQKYITSVRTTDFIQRSLQESLGWAVYENNGPLLWAAVKTEVTAFLTTLYEGGAFAGPTAAGAFQVSVDRSTMTAQDIAAGRLVGSISLNFPETGYVTFSFEARPTS